jgi:signal transduction histidine kinase
LHPWAILVLGALAAGAVAYTTSESPTAGPPNFAVVLRVVIIGALIGAGVYAQTSHIQAAMGTLLIAAGFYSSLWLLNGSSHSILFTVGVFCSGLAPTLFAYLVLAHPEGRVQSRSERWFIAGAGAVLLLVWAVAYLTSPQPPLRTPLIRCIPHCPRNALFLGFTITDALPVLKAIILVSWTTIACAPVLLIFRRMRTAPALVRAPLIPVEFTAVTIAFAWVGYLVARTGASGSADALGGVYVAAAAAIPVAILVGLAMERLFLGQAVAGFTTQLMLTARADPEVLMGAALSDPSLRIAYQRPGRHMMVDSSGTELALPGGDPHRATVWIERGRRAVAAVIYDSRLATNARFVQAAGAAAIMHLENAQLEADLKASTRELAASRSRLVEAADAERQRIERDLHDGIQQQLVGLRLKLDMAAEVIAAEPRRGQGMVLAIGRQMDDLIGTLRSLAGGIYPPLLSDRGLADALKSAAGRAPLPVSVRAGALRRYPQDVEIAVYFCCLEAIQNVAKHAGRGVEAVVRIREEKHVLRFEVSDSGCGFNPGHVSAAHGLVNMRDRMEAVGGTLTVTSSAGSGTSVRGAVPLA